MAKLQAPKGTYDILPSSSGQWQNLEELIRRTFDNYGYQEIRTPIFEYTELFQRGIGSSTDIVEKEMFSFTDRGDRSLTLRPEATAAVVRAYLQHNLAGSGGLAKLYYYGPMFRCEAPQAGRFRQFYQYGAEVLGSADPRTDAEIIALAVSFYRQLNLKDLQVDLNSIGCPNCRPLYRQQLVTALRPQAAHLCANCQRRLETNPLRLLDCKNKVCQDLTADVPVMAAALCPECATHFAEVQRYLAAARIAYRLNPRLVRGFDYYTKTVFEITTTALGAQNALCGGGRYDGLVEECGGPPTAAIGFASGMERLLMVLESQNLLPAVAGQTDLFLAFAGATARDEIFPLVIKLREAGFRVETDLQDRSLKAQLKLADRLGASVTGIIGDDELQQGTIQMRDMRSGEQAAIPRQDLEQYLKEKFSK